jgi:hypothetical protein
MDADMQALNTPAAGSIAGQVLLRLRDRLRKVNGTGGMLNDVDGRVYLRRLKADAMNDIFPAIYIARRPGGGATRVVVDGLQTYWRTQVIFDVVGIVPAGEESTLAGENLLADMYRAVEDPADLYMKTIASDGATPTNLLMEELVVVDENIDDIVASSPLDVVGFGVQCTFPQLYGDPNHVER